MYKPLNIFAATLVLGIALAPAGATAADSTAPQAAGVLLERAEALMEKKDFAAAETLLEKALREHPNNADVVGEMGMLRLRQDKHAQAHEYFSRALKMTRGENGKWRSLVKTAKFWWLLREARDARAAKNFALAENKLDEAIKLDPKVADSYAILGSVQDDQGKASAATASYRQALAISPLNSEALEGLVATYRRQGMTQAQRFIAQLKPEQRKVLGQTIAGIEAAAVEAQVNDQDEFMSALARIPAERRPAHLSHLWGNNLEKLIEEHAKSGRKNEAAKLLQEAETIAANDEEASLAVAVSWGRLDDYRQADRMFGKLRATPPSARWRLRHAGYLAMKEAPELRAELDALAAMPALLPDEKRELYVLQEILALRTADAQINSGAPGLAHQTLAPFLKTSPGRGALLAEARAFRAEEQWASAQSVYARILQMEPGDGDAMSGLIETKMASGDRAGALAQLDKWAAGGTADNPYNGLKMVDLYLALDESARAHQLMGTLLQQYPNQPIVLFEAAQMAHRDGRLDDEIVFLKRSVAADRAERAATSAKTPGSTAPYQQIGFEELDSPQKIQRDWKEKRLAALIDRRTGWFSTAVDIRNRSGTAGMMQLDAVEIPLQYKTPWRQNDEVFFRADLVKLDAGNVDPANGRFGGMQLCQPPALPCPSTMLKQASQGMSFAVGYQQGDFNADIGFTPLNFPVSNTVGGIRYQDSLKAFGYSLEASRRPVTDSLLSFSGTKDPYTGKTWGGVVTSGVRLGISIDKGGEFGFWSTLGWHSLTGKNVQSNQRTQIMAGEQWRIVNEENRQFIVGISGMHWRFAEDAGEYTFGHGGYYSPQSYRSWSLPVTYTERSARFSYMLRGSVSASRAQMRDAPYFPTDSVMQLAAGNPVYTAAPSKSTGYSLTAAGEYQVDLKLFVGGLFSIDRAESYSPNRAALYLRYALDQPAAQPVFMPPEPVEPSSQFK